MYELEQCPFCDQFTHLEKIKRKDGLVQIICTKCGARGPKALDWRTAGERWNKPLEDMRSKFEL